MFILTLEKCDCYKYMMEGFVKVSGSAMGCEDVSKDDNSTCSKHSKLDDRTIQNH